MEPRQQNASEFEERVVAIKRVAKVVKGGRRFSFAALVVVGNKSGEVGFGTGKAGEVPEAIGKASRSAKKSFRNVRLIEGRTIPHEVVGTFGAAKVIMRPAASRDWSDRGRCCPRRSGIGGRKGYSDKVRRHAQCQQCRAGNSGWIEAAAHQ